MITLVDISAAVSRVLSRYDVRKAYLFGSFARGEQTPDSDIDLRLEVDREHGFGLFALSAFGEAVRKETGRQVDLVSSDHLDGDLAAAIEREGVIVYDRA